MIELSINFQQTDDGFLAHITYHVSTLSISLCTCIPTYFCFGMYGHTSCRKKGKTPSTTTCVHAPPPCVHKPHQACRHEQSRILCYGEEYHSAHVHPLPRPTLCGIESVCSWTHCPWHSRGVTAAYDDVFKKSITSRGCSD